MRRLIRCFLLALAALLLALDLWYGWQRTPALPLNSGGGSASLGLVLLGAERGVYVLAVSEQSPAALAGLEPGDYILSADGAALEDVAALDERLSAGASLSLEVRRGDEEMTLTLPGR